MMTEQEMDTFKSFNAIVLAELSNGEVTEVKTGITMLGRTFLNSYGIRGTEFIDSELDYSSTEPMYADEFERIDGQLVPDNVIITNIVEVLDEGDLDIDY